MAEVIGEPDHPPASSPADDRWQPRASTPNGPNPMSPSKREPSPLVFDGDSDRPSPQPARNSPVGPDAVGLDLDLNFAEAAEPSTPTQDKIESHPPRSAWKVMPGFQELDESWAQQSHRDSSQPLQMVKSSLSPTVKDEIQSALSVHAPPLSVDRSNAEDCAQKASSALTGSSFDARASLATSQQQPVQTAAANPRSRKQDSPQDLTQKEWENTDSGASPQLMQTRLPAASDVLRPGPSMSAMRKRSGDLRNGVRDQLYIRSDGTASAPERAREHSGVFSTPRIRPRSFSQSQDVAAVLVPTLTPATSQKADKTHFESFQFSAASDSNKAGFTASEGAGVTFIHYSDVSELPPILRPIWKAANPRVSNPRMPAGRKGKGRGMVGGDIFTPLKLQTMFKTPTPPDAPPIKDMDAGAGSVPEQQESPSEQDKGKGVIYDTQKRDDFPSDMAASQGTLKTPPRPQSQHPLPSMANSAFTFRSTIDVASINSPFAHIATPRTAQKKRGLSAEAYAHIGRASSGSANDARGAMTSTQSLPMRMFLFPGSGPKSGPASVNQSPRRGLLVPSVEDLEEAERLYQQRLGEKESRDVAIACRTKQEGAEAITDTRQPNVPERKRLRLHRPSQSEIVRDDISAHLAIAPPETRGSADKTPSMPSLSPLRLSTRRLPISTTKHPAAGTVQKEEDESPRKIFRKFSAAGQVDKEIACEKLAAFSASQWSDEERKRELELTKQERRIEFARVERANLRTERFTTDQRTVSHLPRVVLVDKNGESEDFPASAHLRTYSQSSLVPSSSTIRRQSLSSTLVNTVDNNAADSDAIIKTRSMPPAASSTIGCGHQLDAPIEEVSTESSSGGAAQQRKSKSYGSRIGSLEINHGSLSPSSDVTKEGNMKIHREGNTSSLPRSTEHSSRRCSDKGFLAMRTGSAPILRPTYALQHLSSLPKSSSALRNEVVLPDADESVSNTKTTSSLSQATSPPPPQRSSLSPPPSIRPAVTPRRDGNPKARAPRSILKSGLRNHNFTSPEALRRSVESPRSISFVDGKSTGRLVAETPLRGTRKVQPQSADDSWEDVVAPTLKRGRNGVTKSAPFVHVSPSDRAARIQELLEQVRRLALGNDTAVQDDFGEDDMNEDGGEVSWQAPSPTSRYSRHLAPLASSRLSDAPGHASRSVGRSVWNFDESAFDRTFLTQASFNIAHNRIVEALTDVVPFVPDWEELKSVDLSSRRLESLVRLKEFVPRLQKLRVDHNTISYLTGLPSSLRVLTASFNNLSSIASFGHLQNLETLDVSNNGIEDINSLNTLTHLRHLKADHNEITSLVGIAGLEHLHTLSLKDNFLVSLELSQTSWQRLENLDVSQNELSHVGSLSSCKSLKVLNVTGNDLSRLDLGMKLPKLRILRVSSNIKLDRLDVLPARELRTLYADFCSLTKIDHLGSLSKLENLSVRQQFTTKRGGFAWPASQVKDTRRLFLSGNSFSVEFAQEAGNIYAPTNNSLRPTGLPNTRLTPNPFTNLVYLELAACQLETLPSGFASLFPELHQLNLDHNLFSRLPARAFEGINKLKRVSLVGCRLRSTRVLVEAFEGCDALSVLDTRMNPATLGLYPPILAPARRDGERPTSSFVAPIPNFEIFRPDVASWKFERAQREQRRRQADLYDKSFFHRKHAAPQARRGASDSGDESEDDQDDVDEAVDLNAVQLSHGATSPAASYALADAHFSRTLPANFALSRTLHRGTLGLVCPALTWLDGLVLGQNEVGKAEELLLKDEPEEPTLAREIEPSRGLDRARYRSRIPRERRGSVRSG